VELVRRGGETVQQDYSWLRLIPGLAVEECESRNVGGLEVHKAPQNAANSPSWQAVVDAGFIQKTDYLRNPV